MFASRLAASSLLFTGVVLCASCSRSGDSKDRTSEELGKTNATTVPAPMLPDSGSAEEDDAVLQDESEASPTLEATSDDAVDTSGGSTSCAALTDAAEAEAEAIFTDADRRCETNDDCTTVRYIPKCLDGCDGMTTVAKSGADAVQDAVLALDESVCVDFDAAGCVISPSGCPFTPGFSPACVQQRCEYVREEDEQTDPGPSPLIDAGAHAETADAGGCLGQSDCAWVERAALPTPTSRLAATTYAGKLYTFGGVGRADPDHAASYSFDPASDGWQRLSPLPIGAYGLDAHTVDDTLYAFLAYGNSGFVNDVFAYDPASDTWSERSSRPTQRYIFASAVVDTRVFIIGGLGTPDDDSAADWEYKYDVEIYDTQADTWSSEAGLPNAIAAAASCSMGDLIYLFGGDVNGTLVYDTAEGTWTERTPPSLARADHECVRVGDSFVLMGGRDGAGNQFDVIERYEPATDTWTELEPLPAPRYWFAASELGGSVYVVGGETFATTGELELDSVLEFSL